MSAHSQKTLNQAIYLFKDLRHRNGAKWHTRCWRGTLPLQRLSQGIRVEQRGESSLLSHLIYLEIHFSLSLTFPFRLKETRMYINVAGLAAWLILRSCSRELQSCLTSVSSNNVVQWLPPDLVVLKPSSLLLRAYYRSYLLRSWFRRWEFVYGMATNLPNPGIGKTAVYLAKNGPSLPCTVQYK